MNQVDKVKVFIVGAGISGLTSGIFAQKSGFDVTIFEQHVIPGGLSQSWKRKGYNFEGGMHWLSGSKETLALNDVLKSCGALKENNPVYFRDPVYTVLSDGGNLSFVRDLEKFRENLLAVSPEDKKAIDRLMFHVKCFLNVQQPVMDIFGLKSGPHKVTSILEFIKMAPVGLIYNTLLNMTFDEYVSQFKNPKIRALLKSVVGYDYNAMSFIFTMAGFISGDYGYPKGGSTQMVANMEETFISLGGKIQYKSKVDKIIVENGTVKGILVNGEEIPCDAVIVSQDRKRCNEDLFDVPLDEPWVKRLETIEGEENMYVGIGVKADLKDYPDCFIVPLDEPYEAGGKKFTELRINNYCRHEGYAPEGCTSLTCLLLGQSYGYWKQAKDDGTYKDKKADCVERFIQILCKAIPEIEGKVEVSDFATPVTYERYCSSYHGSWMSQFRKGEKFFRFPSKSSTVKGLYFEGQRTEMPGGLPTTFCSARKAAQVLCRDYGVKFISK